MATMETCYLLVEKKLNGGLRCGLNVGEHELQLEPKSGWISGGIKGLELNYEGCHCGLGKLAAVADQGHTETWLLWMLCHKTHTGGRKGGPSPFCGLWPFCAHMHSNGHILLLNNNKTTISAYLRGNHSSIHEALPFLLQVKIHLPNIIVPVASLFRLIPIPMDIRLLKD